MSETTITQLPDPSGFNAELATLMTAFSGERLEDGRAHLARHGHLPEIIQGVEFLDGIRQLQNAA